MRILNKTEDKGVTRKHRMNKPKTIRTSEWDHDSIEATQTK